MEHELVVTCNMSTKYTILISLHRLDDLTEVIKGAFLSIPSRHHSDWESYDWHIFETDGYKRRETPSSIQIKILNHLVIKNLI